MLTQDKTSIENESMDSTSIQVGLDSVVRINDLIKDFMLDFNDYVRQKYEF